MCVVFSVITRDVNTSDVKQGTEPVVIVTDILQPIKNSGNYTGDQPGGQIHYIHKPKTTAEKTDRKTNSGNFMKFSWENETAPDLINVIKTSNTQNPNTDSSNDQNSNDVSGKVNSHAGSRLPKFGSFKGSRKPQSSKLPSFGSIRRLKKPQILSKTFATSSPK